MQCKEVLQFILWEIASLEGGGQHNNICLRESHSANNVQGKGMWAPELLDQSGTRDEKENGLGDAFVVLTQVKVDCNVMDWDRKSRGQINFFMEKGKIFWMHLGNEDLISKLRSGKQN